jgi:hypothetical protein
MQPVPVYPVLLFITVCDPLYTVNTSVPVAANSGASIISKFLR